VAATALTDWLAHRLDRSSGQPMYRQLYELLQSAILSGAMPANAKVPSSRTLAVELGVARNTVTLVFEQLVLEGYLVAASGRGTFVAELGQAAGIREQPARPNRLPTVDQPFLSHRGRELFHGAVVFERHPGAFMPGVPDLTCFPTQIWARLQMKHWRRPQAIALSYAPPGGQSDLRNAIANYVRTARSVRCSPSQVVVTTGNHQSIDLTIQLLTDPGDLIWTEDPCYWGTRSVLQASGLTLKAIPVDSEGILPSSIDQQSPPKVILVTPSHQYPLGMAMSLRRRRLLLEYASQHSCWIIEDDCNSEFRYETKPLPSLQGMDESGRVLYINSFSQSLFPGVRLGFVVVPPDLAPIFAIASTDLDREGQELHQAVLAQFLDEGYFNSHIRRMRALYRERRDLLVGAIKNRFGNELQIAGGDVGLHVTLLLPDHVDDRSVARTAAEAGIVVRPLSVYFKNRSDSIRGILLGYACVTNDDIEPDFAVLANILDDYLK
jgi:Transcriptional regulators containing a DNA-binding HTH domain and an aminotransferase domain (MocR family) and their eukaryotic orthologs